MIVISDTSALLYLARVGSLHLLRDLFVEVIVPRTVWSELVAGRPEAPGLAAVHAAEWLRVEPDAALPPGTEEILASVDAGESAAIALALDRHADLLLIDDAAGRRAAEELGVAVRGTLGVLVSAKARGLITAVGPLVAALLAEGFRASPAVIAQVLVAAGEQPAS